MLGVATQTSKVLDLILKDRISEASERCYLCPADRQIDAVVTLKTA